MWVLRTLPDLPPEPLTFRLLPGGARTVGRTFRADFILDACARLARPLPSRGRRRRQARGRGSLQHERHVRERSPNRTRRARSRRSAAHRPGRADGEPRGRCVGGRARHRGPPTIAPHAVTSGGSCQSTAPQRRRHPTRAILSRALDARQLRKGLCCRSSPMVVTGPWPE